MFNCQTVNVLEEQEPRLITNLVSLDRPAIPGREVDWFESSAVEGDDRLELVVRRILKVVRRDVILKYIILFEP